MCDDVNLIDGAEDVNLIDGADDGAEDVDLIDGADDDLSDGVENSDDVDSGDEAVRNEAVRNVVNSDDFGMWLTQMIRWTSRNGSGLSLSSLLLRLDFGVRELCGTGRWYLRLQILVVDC